MTNPVAKQLITDLKVAEKHLHNVLNAYHKYEHTGDLWFMDKSQYQRIEEALEEIHILREVLS